MAEFNINDYGFERTVWANIQLAKLCPGNNIQKFTEVINGEDTVKQLNAMMDIALIMNEAYVRKQKRLDPNFDGKLLSREILEDMDEDTISTVCLTAMGQFKEDGKVTVDAEPKKEKAEETES